MRYLTGTDAGSTEFIPERLNVVARVSNQREQVTGIVPGDLQADLRVVFLRGHAVDIGDVQRLDVDERGDFQRADAVVRPLGVVPAWLVAVEAGDIDSSVAEGFSALRPRNVTSMKRRFVSMEWDT